jgi:RNA polymerase sigma-70 factor (ECF subfamily)
LGSWDAETDPLAALREGDPGPYEAFVRAEAGAFLGFFRRLGAGRHEAEDLVQETFLKMFHAASRYQPRERFTAYAFRVARNAWIDRQRRRGSRPPLAADGGEDVPAREPASPGREDPFEYAVRDEEAERLRAAMVLLPETHRSVFELGAMQGMAYAEIGELLGVPVGTVKSRMFHAVRKLRAALEEESGARSSRAAGGPR